MSNKFFLILFSLIFLISFTSAAAPVTQVQQFTEGYSIEETAREYLIQNQDYQYNFFVYNKSNGILIDNSSVNCSFILSNSSGNILFNNPVAYNPSTFKWTTDILGENFSKSSVYPYGVVCQSDSFGGALTGVFEVTTNGESKEPVQLWLRVFLILLSISLIILIHWNKNRIDYDKWYDKITQKYQEKNTFKWVLSALGQIMMKNSYIFSYLVGLFGLLILTDLVYYFNITSSLQVMKIIFGLYTWSALIVVMVFFSQVQEWITEWVKDIKNINWGWGGMQ